MLVTLRGQREVHPFFTRHLIISLPLTETTLTRGLRKITFLTFSKLTLEIM